MTVPRSDDESTMRAAAKAAADQLGPLSNAQRAALAELLIPVQHVRRKAA